MQTSSFLQDDEMNTLELGQPVGITLERFIKRKEDEFPYATGELSQLLRDIGLAAKIVNRAIGRSGLLGVEGSFGKENVQGEEQQKLDVIANIRFIRALRNGGQVCAIISEEEETVISIDQNARYIIAIDPLDGSSNIDVNVSIGTIFSIYRRKTPQGSPLQGQDYMQKGTEQVAAGYVLYSSSTMMVYTTGCGVNGFTYEPTLGEFFLSHPNIKIPQDGSIYSVNHCNYAHFPAYVKHYIDTCNEQGISSRYIGSLVADFHRNMLKGGIFLYPPTQKHPSGKLRLLSECNALAMVVEQAGGRAMDGTRRILEIHPESLHQRTPLYIGSTLMVQQLLSGISTSVPVLPEFKEATG